MKVRGFLVFALIASSLASCKTRDFNTDNSADVESAISAAEKEIVESLNKNDGRVWNIVEEKAGGNAALGWGTALKNPNIWSAAKRSVKFLQKFGDSAESAVSGYFIKAGSRIDAAISKVKNVPAVKYFKMSTKNALRDANLSYDATIAGMRKMGYSPDVAEKVATGTPFSSMARQVSDAEAYSEAAISNNRDGVMAAIYENGTARSFVENEMKDLPKDVRESALAQVPAGAEDINVAKENGFLDPWAEKVTPEEMPGLVRSKRLPALEGADGEAGGAGEILSDMTNRELKIEKKGAFQRALAKCSCAIHEASGYMATLSKTFGGLFGREAARVAKTDELFSKGFMESGAFHKFVTAEEGRLILDVPGKGKQVFASAEELHSAINETGNWNALVSAKAVTPK